MVKAVRGAVSLDKNTEIELQEKIDILFRELLIKNNIKTGGYGFIAVLVVGLAQLLYNNIHIKTNDFHLSSFSKRGCSGKRSSLF